MKRIVKKLAALLTFPVAIPLLAGLATKALWNSILIPACGFSAIGLWQGVGIFILCQILSGGFFFGCFFIAASIHHVAEHPRGGVGHHWHNMTDEERREFIKRRAGFDFRNNGQNNGDATE